MDASRLYYFNELAWTLDEAPSWLWSRMVGEVSAITAERFEKSENVW